MTGNVTGGPVTSVRSGKNKPPAAAGQPPERLVGRTAAHAPALFRTIASRSISAWTAAADWPTKLS